MGMLINFWVCTLTSFENWGGSSSICFPKWLWKLNKMIYIKVQHMSTQLKWPIIILGSDDIFSGYTDVERGFCNEWMAHFCLWLPTWRTTNFHSFSFTQVSFSALISKDEDQWARLPSHPTEAKSAWEDQVSFWTGIANHGHFPMELQNVKPGGGLGAPFHLLDKETETQRGPTPGWKLLGRYTEA